MKLTRPLSGVLAASPVVSGGLAERVRARDWSGTPLGPSHSWPAALRTAVSILLTSPEPMLLCWGDEQTLLYNDAASRLLFTRDADLLGQPLASALPDLWSQVDQAITRT